MDWTNRRRRFCSFLEGEGCVYPASVFDPVSARIAEDLGFEVGMLAGSIASFVVLGAPDVVVLTLTEFAEQVLRINRASKLPLMVDADHGYGNALSVMRTVQELETAGVAALTIEDTLLPRAYGSRATGLVSIEEGVGKMRAALEAREDKELVVLGRTSAVAMAGIEEAANRIQAYEEAGVDGIFLAGVKTRAELDAIAHVVRVPLVLGGAGDELLEPSYLAQRGVRFALQGHQPFAAAVRAVHDTMKALRAGASPKSVLAAGSAELIKHVTREATYDDWTKRFLGA
jgi:oxaloacetate decarboxylase